MKTFIVLLMIMLIPISAFGTPTIGIFFEPTPYKMHYNPSQYEQFVGYVFVHNIDCFLSAVEFKMNLPDGILYLTPPGPMYLPDPPTRSVSSGSPTSGYLLAMYPPLNGWMPGYNLVVSFMLFSQKSCGTGAGQFIDQPIVFTKYPSSAGDDPRFTCYPENESYPMVGLTSIICPSEGIAVEEESWGAIKSMYK